MEAIYNNSFTVCNNSDSHLNLVCFPYAGGGASIFNSWKKEFNRLGINVYPIQFPGRENRISEEPFTSMDELVESTYKEVYKLMGEKCILFGHSLGAKVAFEIARKIKEIFCIEPCHLIFSGCNAPHIKEKNPISFLTDKKFIKALYRYDGTSKEILENESIMKFFLPMLRADFLIAESYNTKKRKYFNCPITILAGTKDDETISEDLREWKYYTSGEAKIKFIEGNHFFIKNKEESVFENIINIIENLK